MQKCLEKKVCIDYNRIVGEGIFSSAVSAFSFGAGNLLKCAVGPLAAKSTLVVGAGLTAKSLATTLIANVAGSAVSETTVLGSYKSDTKAILKELGNVKSLDFGPRDGGFNLLNTPNELYISSSQFWNEYNKPWLDNVIAREDIIKIATEPTWDNLTRTNKITGKKELTGFGREYAYLKQHGYKYNSITKIMNR